MEEPEKVNMTAEKDVDDDEDIPDLSSLRLNTENVHLFLEQANGKSTFYSTMASFLTKSVSVLLRIIFYRVDEELPPIKHGNPITDRRSTFQPHLAPVVTPRQVQHGNEYNKK